MTDTHPHSHILTVHSHSQCFDCVSVHTPPVIILCQSHLLKVNVEPVAFRGLQDPVARQIVAVVARKTRRDDTTIGGIFNHSPTGCYGKGKDKELKGRTMKNVMTSTIVEGVGGKSMSEQRLPQYRVNIRWTVAGLHGSPGSKSVRLCVMDL